MYNQTIKTSNKKKSFITIYLLDIISCWKLNWKQVLNLRFNCDSFALDVAFRDENT